jgi:hypothetical protein
VYWYSSSVDTGAAVFPGQKNDLLDRTLRRISIAAEFRPPKRKMYYNRSCREGTSSRSC